MVFRGGYLSPQGRVQTADPHGMDGSIHTTGAIVYAPGAGPLALGPNAVRKKNNKQHDHHPPCVAMYSLFEIRKSLPCLVRFEGDQVLGIRLCIVIRNKNLGIAYVVNR